MTAENNEIRTYTVKELAETIWMKINGDLPFRYCTSPSFDYDVQYRMPDTNKAKRILGWEPEYDLYEILEEMKDATK